MLAKCRSKLLPVNLSILFHYDKRFKYYKPQNPEEVAKMDTYQFVNDSLQEKRSESLFGWGFASTGGLGIESFLMNQDPDYPRLKTIRAPRLISFFNSNCKIYDIAAGYGFTVIAATYKKTSHLLFGFGLNTDSQLGVQFNQQNEPLSCVANPVPINLPLNDQQTSAKIQEKVIKVSCGRAHTVCLTNFSNVYTLGNNSFGQCGRKAIEGEKYFASKKINQIKYDKNDPIVDVICGLDHSLFLTNSGAVYSCGWGNDGQLGNGTLQSSGIITKVIGDIEGEKIISLSCAGDTILALNDKGQVFGWGNSEYNQLCKADDEKQLKVSRYLNLESKIGKAISIAAAGSMCSVINDSGRVFVWGYGILGLGPSEVEQTLPTELNLKLFGKNNNMVKVIAGLHHLGAINDKGELFMWGKNRRGNLGTGFNSDLWFPYRISIPTSKVLKLSLGLDHSIAFGRNVI